VALGSNRNGCTRLLCAVHRCYVLQSVLRTGQAISSTSSSNTPANCNIHTAVPGGAPCSPACYMRGRIPKRRTASRSGGLRGFLSRQRKSMLRRSGNWRTPLLWGLSKAVPSLWSAANGRSLGARGVRRLESAGWRRQRKRQWIRGQCRADVEGGLMPAAVRAGQAMQGGEGTRGSMGHHMLCKSRAQSWHAPVHARVQR